MQQTLGEHAALRHAPPEITMIRQRMFVVHLIGAICGVICFPFLVLSSPIGFWMALFAVAVGAYGAFRFSSDNVVFTHNLFFGVRSLPMMFTIADALLVAGTAFYVLLGIILIMVLDLSGAGKGLLGGSIAMAVIGCACGVIGVVGARQLAPLIDQAFEAARAENPMMGQHPQMQQPQPMPAQVVVVQQQAPYGQQQPPMMMPQQAPYPAAQPGAAYGQPQPGTPVQYQPQQQYQQPPPPLPPQQYQQQPQQYQQPQPQYQPGAPSPGYNTMPPSAQPYGHAQSPPQPSHQPPPQLPQQGAKDSAPLPPPRV